MSKRHLSERQRRIVKFEQRRDNSVREAVWLLNEFDVWQADTIRRRLNHRPIHKDVKRGNLVDQIAAILSASRLSKFEHEADCRHRIRHSLVVQGYPWQRSDDEAHLIVSAALQQIGAVRPTSQEAAPDAVDRENCIGCGRDLDVSDFGLRRVSFCTDHCRARWLIRRNEKSENASEAARWKVDAVLWRQRRKKILCAQCGELFWPPRPDSTLCGPKCVQDHREDRVSERACNVCATLFRPQSEEKVGKYCSTKCYQSTRNLIPSTNCPQCSAVFTPATRSQIRCSRVCDLASIPPRPCIRCGTEFKPGSYAGRYCESCGPAARRRKSEHTIQKLFDAA